MGIDPGRPVNPNPLIAFAGTERVTDSGIVLPASGSYRAWVKLKGEPAQVFIESAEEVIERWLAFAADPSRTATNFHLYEYGLPAYFLRAALGELAYVSVSFQTRPPRAEPGSYWLGQCQCSFCQAER